MNNPKKRIIQIAKNLHANGAIDSAIKNKNIKDLEYY
jgi:hypothetical protein